MKGKMIAIEGIDGSGKTTLTARLRDSLGERALMTHEPMKRELSAYADSRGRDEYSIVAKALAFVHDRAEHTLDILQHLKEGRIVISDRYFLSTIAYQGAEFELEGMDRREWLRGLNTPFSVLTDMLIYLDAEPERAVARIGERRRGMFESSLFLSLVRKNYMAEFDRFTGRKIFIGASLLPEEAHTMVVREINSMEGY